MCAVISIRQVLEKFVCTTYDYKLLITAPHSLSVCWCVCVWVMLHKHYATTYLLVSFDNDNDFNVMFVYEDQN